jgi:DNA-binding transcriptional LysR family regulator
MDLRHLYTFRSAARNLSFTKAGQSLGYAQSSVTAQIKGLEEELGSVLFNRVGNRLELTEAGQRFLAYAERILDLTEEAMASAQEQAGSRSLRLTAPESVCTYVLPPIFRELKTRCPDLRIHFLPCLVRDIKHEVLEGAVDMAFLLEEPFPSKVLVMERLRDEPILVAAAPGHPLAGAGRLRVEDLAGEEILLKAIGCGYRTLFERRLLAAGVRPSYATEFLGVETIKRCVQAGLGIAPLPRLAVAEELQSGRLVALPVDDLDLQVTLFLVWNAKRQLSTPERLFLDQVRERMAQAGA